METKLEINDEDLQEIIEEYLFRHADFDIDEVEIVNNRPMNIWLYALVENMSKMLMIPPLTKPKWK